MATFDPNNQIENQTHMQEYKVTTGRGGAGNIHKSVSKPSPLLLPLKSNSKPSANTNTQQKVPRFAIGRGGAGNIFHDPHLTRSAQQLDANDNINYSDVINDIDDYISPINSDMVDDSGLTNTRSRLSGTKSHQSMHSAMSSPNNGSSKAAPIVVGRGGAGNIFFNKKKLKAASDSGNAQDTIQGLSGEGEGEGVDVDEDTINATDNNLFVVTSNGNAVSAIKSTSKKSKSKHKSKSSPEKFAIGRGGAGNIVSPKPSSNTIHHNPDEEEDDLKNDKSNDKKKKKKKKKSGFFNSLKTMFT
ncbi:hypothetical protein SUVZ_04G0700 [Saccharomyces uvarum]|uniref:Protein PAR32 n=1 Tax=Saccharomyces uvarum TaxID=230603 RepID=A0ABN8WVS2_SACUV|nr:hypothetical protein SUVZ_04G0700 [Saccharomyces uvarum]